MLGVPWTYRVRLAQNYVEQEHTILGRRRRASQRYKLVANLVPGWANKWRPSSHNYVSSKEIGPKPYKWGNHSPSARYPKPLSHVSCLVSQ
jgi:hypothetical protein